MLVLRLFFPVSSWRNTRESTLPIQSCAEEELFKERQIHAYRLVTGQLLSPPGVSLDDRLPWWVHRGASVQAPGPLLSLPLPHYHELHQDLPQGTWNKLTCFYSDRPDRVLVAHCLATSTGTQPGQGHRRDQENDGDLQREESTSFLNSSHGSQT